MAWFGACVWDCSFLEGGQTADRGGELDTCAALQSVMHDFEVRNPVVSNSQCLGGSTIN